MTTTGPLNTVINNRAPDKLRIFVFYDIKTHVLSDQSVHITHTYCCVSKLSKFGAYLYLYAVNDNTVYINNTFLSLRNSLQLLPFILFEGESVYIRGVPNVSTLPFKASMSKEI